MFLSDGSECALSVIIGRNHFFYDHLDGDDDSGESCLPYCFTKWFLGSSHMWSASCIVLVFRGNMFLDYDAPRKVLFIKLSHCMNMVG